MLSFFSDKLKSLFLRNVIFSDAGSSEREKEAVTYTLFLDLLYECEQHVYEGEIHQYYCSTVTLRTFSPLDLTLQDILSFFSGGEGIPPTGFETSSSLRFSRASVLPTASICAVSLTLPTCYHDQPEVFKQKMLIAIMNHGGFGLW